MIDGYSPVFEKDGKEFIFLYSSMVAINLYEAEKIGYGMEFSDGIIGGYKYKRSVLINNLKGIDAKLGLADIFVITEDN